MITGFWNKFSIRNAYFIFSFGFGIWCALHEFKAEPNRSWNFSLKPKKVNSLDFKRFLVESNSNFFMIPSENIAYFNTYEISGYNKTKSR